MDKITKLTLEELVRRKEQMLEKKKQKKTKEFFIESLGGSITVTAPDRHLVADAQSMEDPDAYLVYEVVTEPSLKKLSQEYECGIPTDIVDIIFKGSEVGAIVKAALELGGYHNGIVKPVEEIKN